MEYRMFFTDYCEDKSLPSQEAEARELESILHSMDCVLHMPRNFLGITDSAGTTIQFMVNEDNSIFVDVPAPNEKGSYSMTTDLASCISLVRELNGNIDLKNYSQLQFAPWGAPTDEVPTKPWWKFW